MADLNTVSTGSKDASSTITTSASSGSAANAKATGSSSTITSISSDAMASISSDGSIISSDGSSISSDGGNSTDSGSYNDSSDSTATPDVAGNTIFFLAIVAFLAIGLGLGIWLWKKNQRTKAAANGGGSEKQSTGGFFSRAKKGRPSPLPMSKIRNGEEQSLPPYSAGSPFDFARSPFSNGTGATPFLDQKSLLAQQQQQPDVSHSGEWDAASSVDSRVPPTPFSPFQPFSPVNATSLGVSRDLTAAASQARSYTPAIRSSLYQAETISAPSSGQYMDPEAAQAMGIHPDVLNEAKPGVSEEEIERRRARAQRRLERQQRAEEGTIVEEDRSEAPSFRQIAKAAEV